MSQPQPQNQSQPPENTPNDQTSPTPSTTEAPGNADMLQHLLAALGPVVNFHKTVESASDNDLRMFWEIRLVQGKDTPFTTINGHSSFPGILVGSSLGQMPNVLSREVVEKIALPLAARLQDMSNERALQAVPQPVKGTLVQKPAKPAAVVDSNAEVTGEAILPDSERNEIIDVMLPKDLVDEAAGIISELKKSE